MFAGVSLFNVTLNGLGCFFLSRCWGIAGIAASGSITFAIGTALLAAMVKRRTNTIVTREELGLVAKVAIATLVMVCVSLSLSRQLTETVTGAFGPQPWISLGSWVGGATIYVLCLFLLKVEEARTAVARSFAWCRRLLGRDTG